MPFAYITSDTQCADKRFGLLDAWYGGKEGEKCSANAAKVPFVSPVSLPRPPPPPPLHQPPCSSPPCRDGGKEGGEGTEVGGEGDYIPIATLSPPPT